MGKKKTKYISLDEIKAEHAAMDEKSFREAGYMSIDEFLTRFNFGLKEHLHNTWHGISTSDLHHPEDLAANALTYAENVFQVIGVFGVASTYEG